MKSHRDVSPMPADAAGLPAAGPSRTIDIPHGGTFELPVRMVAKTIGEHTFPMLGYGGAIPGPTLRVRQGSEVFVTVRNETDSETTVHWHGLRLENAHDGVPNLTQEPIPPGGQYTHRLTFPDAGTFWYHPHIREDYAQELGLYGNVIVEPTEAGYWPDADREIVLTLDDILIEDGKITPFGAEGANFAAMGRFGNVLLVGGETHRSFEVCQGEVVRFLFTNTANTRVFKITFPGLRMKSVGGDAGRYEREEWVDAVVVAPSERAVVDVLFDSPGAFSLQHLTPRRAYALAEIDVVGPAIAPDRPAAFEVLRVNAEMAAERGRIAPYLLAPPDKTLALVAEMDHTSPQEGSGVLYICPMHPEVVRDHPGKCPICGMKLVPVGASSAEESEAAHGGHEHGHGERSHGEGEADLLEGGIEWEDLMPEVNRGTTAATMRWKALDTATGRANADIDWAFDIGDQVKVRIVNEMDSDHPMHHPFHIHGERFLVLARDGVPEPNLVWKDTVLIPTGQIVDILIDAVNPGRWMAHCHIAEHLDVGMMFEFTVGEASRTS